eukprot:TRINITY_DN29871_c0_g3_i2.p1 TRINITY_DN29871_c0_g3~~TRINITY_DN29871_c0_g3_i2.p1  ORF type:complete len:386 (-),score=54.40 TRINITY_DN29871_c0_g3_i2:748-1905(-)
MAPDTANTLTRRDRLVAEVFKCLDISSCGLLRQSEMYRVALETGFDGDEEQWQEEYKGLCQDLDRDPAVGLDLATFKSFVNDRSEAGCYCSEDELIELAGGALNLGMDELWDAAESLQGQRGRPPASVLLRQQYRMHPSLNRFSSEHFYGGKVGNDISTLHRAAGLLVHPTTGQRCAVLFWPNLPSFCEEMQVVATRDASTHSKANPQEAERCVSIAVGLAARVGARNVAVLSWYNAQVTELKRRLRAAGCDTVHCGSVVTSQGCEWDYVLLSTVRAASASGGPSSAALGCLADRHLLNVAVTRGRLGIVVLGSPELLRANRSWRAFLEHYRDEGCVLSAEDVPILAGTPARPGGHSAEGPRSRDDQVFAGDLQASLPSSSPQPT